MTGGPAKGGAAGGRSAEQAANPASRRVGQAGSPCLQGPDEILRANQGWEQAFPDSQGSIGRQDDLRDPGKALETGQLVLAWSAQHRNCWASLFHLSDARSLPRRQDAEAVACAGHAHQRPHVFGGGPVVDEVFVARAEADATVAVDHDGSSDAGVAVHLVHHTRGVLSVDGIDGPKEFAVAVELEGPVDSKK